MYEVPDALRKLRQSDVGTMNSCGRKLELAKLHGHRSPGSRKSMMGTALHRALEGVMRPLVVGDRIDLKEADQFGMDNLEASFRLARPEEIDLAEGESVDDALDHGRRIVRAAFDKYLVEVLPTVVAAGKPLAVEADMELEYRGFLITGRLDLLDGQAVLRDHKLTMAALSKEMPTAYWAQMARYVWLAHESLGVLPTAAQIDMISAARLQTKAQTLEYRAYREDDVATLLRVGQESVDHALDLIEAGIFARNAMGSYRGMCDYCAFRGDLCMGRTPAASVSAAPAEPAAGPVTGAA